MVLAAMVAEPALLPCYKAIPKTFSLGIDGGCDDFSGHRCLVTSFATFETGAMDTSFENALIKFRASLTESQRRDFAPCTLNDVHIAIKNIQLRLGSQRKLRSMKKIAKFIEAMTQLGQVVEVFLNVQNTVAFIWVRTKPLC